MIVLKIDEKKPLIFFPLIGFVGGSLIGVGYLNNIFNKIVLILGENKTNYQVNRVYDLVKYLHVSIIFLGILFALVGLNIALVYIIKRNVINRNDG